MSILSKDEILNKLFCGDTLKILKKFPSNSIDMAITSPPYFRLRKYLPQSHPLKNSRKRT